MCLARYGPEPAANATGHDYGYQLHSFNPIQQPAALSGRDDPFNGSDLLGYKLGIGSRLDIQPQQWLGIDMRMFIRQSANSRLRPSAVSVRGRSCS